MSIQVIPTYSDAFYDMVVNMEGTDYHLTFTYNQRENAYYFSIGTPDGDDIVNGIKIVSSWPLLKNWADPRLPAGDIFCIPNTTTTDPAPGLGQIGPGLPWTLYYVTHDQLPGYGAPLVV